MADAFPLRMGAVLAAPVRALRAVDARGGGVRDTLWLVVAGVVGFRVEQLARAAMALSHLAPALVLQQLVSAALQEVNEAAVVTIAGSVLITLLAGRRRDPAADFELGASCYVPFFAMRAVYRLGEVMVGPFPPWLADVSFAAAIAWSLATAAIAIHVARSRVAAPEAPAAIPRRRTLPAAAALGSVLLASLVVNAAWVARHVDAIRPFHAGEPAPTFTLPRIDGGPGSVALASLRGQVVVLDFWATWCGPCVKMLPVMHDLAARWHPHGVEVVGVDADGEQATPAEVRAFLARHPAPYPMVGDDDGRVAALYKVTALPHIVLINRDGNIRKTFWGMATQHELDQALGAATGAAPLPR